MMLFFDNLHKIYDEKYFIKHHNGCLIKEDQPEALVKELKLTNNNGYIYCINKEVLKVFDKILVSNENAIIELIHECDGLFFINHEGCRYLFLVELKSKFCITNIEHAKKQFVASYIKIASILSLLKDITIKDFKVFALLVSFGLGTEEKTMYSKALETNKRKYFEERFCLSLAEKSTIVLDKTYFSSSAQALINDGYLFDDLKIIHLPVKKSDYGIGISIQNLMNKL